MSHFDRRQKTMKKISIALATSLFVLSALPVLAKRGPESLTGKPMPGFTMMDVSGKKHTNASLKGKVVLLDFWATWCGPCKKASPVMQSLHTKYGSKGLVVVGANTWEQGDNKGSAARGYAKEHGYSYTFTYGNDNLAKSLGIEGIPTMILIDKSGKVSYVQVGFDPSLESKLEGLIKPLLK